VHDTDVQGFAAFNANLAAKAAKATPFKRPENVAYLPNGTFRTFFFDPTGDTNALAGNVPELAARGAWGSIFRVDLDATRDKGRLAIFALGDADHAAFDNIYFLDEKTLLAAEDRGDTLHGQLNKLDSIWAYPIDGAAPKRFLALGRDLNSNDGGDNEPTGVMVNNGSDDKRAMVGTRASLEDARAFFTQQHGQNNVWRIVGLDDDDDR
jgi:secreted PhoX family phosphatase